MNLKTILQSSVFAATLASQSLGQEPCTIEKPMPTPPPQSSSGNILNRSVPETVPVTMRSNNGDPIVYVALKDASIDECIGRAFIVTMDLTRNVSAIRSKGISDEERWERLRQSPHGLLPQYYVVMNSKGEPIASEVMTPTPAGPNSLNFPRVNNNSNGEQITHYLSPERLAILDYIRLKANLPTLADAAKAVGLDPNETCKIIEEHTVLSEESSSPFPWLLVDHIKEQKFHNPNYSPKDVEVIIDWVYPKKPRASKEQKVVIDTFINRIYDAFCFLENNRLIGSYRNNSDLPLPDRYKGTSEYLLYVLRINAPRLMGELSALNKSSKGDSKQLWDHIYDYIRVGHISYCAEKLAEPFENLIQQYKGRFVDLSKDWEFRSLPYRDNEQKEDVSCIASSLDLRKPFVDSVIKHILENDERKRSIPAFILRLLDNMGYDHNTLANFMTARQTITRQMRADRQSSLWSALKTTVIAYNSGNVIDLSAHPMNAEELSDLVKKTTPDRIRNASVTEEQMQQKITNFQQDCSQLEEKLKTYYSQKSVLEKKEELLSSANLSYEAANAALKSEEETFASVKSAYENFDKTISSLEQRIKELDKLIADYKKWKWKDLLTLGIAYVVRNVGISDYEDEKTQKGMDINKTKLAKQNYFDHQYYQQTQRVENAKVNIIPAKSYLDNTQASVAAEGKVLDEKRKEAVDYSIQVNREIVPNGREFHTDYRLKTTRLNGHPLYNLNAGKSSDVLFDMMPEYTVGGKTVKRRELYSERFLDMPAIKVRDVMLTYKQLFEKVPNLFEVCRFLPNQSEDTRMMSVNMLLEHLNFWAEEQVSGLDSISHRRNETALHGKKSMNPEDERQKRFSMLANPFVTSGEYYSPR